MNGVETDALRLKHGIARFNRAAPAAGRDPPRRATPCNHGQLADRRRPLATGNYCGLRARWPSVTAAVAQNEPDPTGRRPIASACWKTSITCTATRRCSIASGQGCQQHPAGLYRHRARAENIEHHRHPENDIRDNYEKNSAALITKIHAALITGAEYQTHDYYMNIGPLFADPLARQLYARSRRWKSST